MSHQNWWNAPSEKVHTEVIRYVQAVEQEQADIFDRFVKLAALYRRSAAYSDRARGGNEQMGQVTENVVASNIDTVAAIVAPTEIRARFMTDGADWSTQRRARELGYYSEEVAKLFDVHAKCQLQFKAGAALKGTGLNKVYVDAFDEIRVEPVLVDDIIVDERECTNGGRPKQMHQRRTVDREELVAEFPEYEREIRAAHSVPGHTARRWAGYRPFQDNEVIVIESWRLPIGRKGRNGYRPGRHTITIENCDLLDEEWHKTHFPFAVMRWSESDDGWYGISLAERIAGIQRALNKRNLQIDRALDQHAFPVRFVSIADAALAAKSVNRAGTIVPYTGEIPKTDMPPAVSGEVYAHRQELKSAAFEESGVSRMTAHAAKPAGLDSGAALREFKDATTQRFAMQEKSYERFILDTIFLILDCCKDLGDEAPVITRLSRFGAKKIKWSQVDMKETRVQMVAASGLPRTPAGRYQTALEWAQAGVISVDEWRKLTEHPDLDRILSLYTQGMQSVERDIEAIRDGEYVAPEPFGNLQLMVRMGQMAYLQDRDLGAPEEILEGLRNYTVQAAALMAQKSAPAQNANMPAGMPAGAPAADPAMAAGAGMIPPEMPGAMQPVSAFAPEGNLLAS